MVHSKLQRTICPVITSAWVNNLLVYYLQQDWRWSTFGRHIARFYSIYLSLIFILQINLIMQSSLATPRWNVNACNARFIWYFHSSISSNACKTRCLLIPKQLFGNWISRFVYSNRRVLFTPKLKLSPIKKWCCIYLILFYYYKCEWTR